MRRAETDAARRQTASQPQRGARSPTPGICRASFPNDKAWEEAFAAWQKQIEGYAAFQGKLAESPETLAACLQFDLDVDRAGERLGTYAMLKTSEDQSNSVYQRMQGRFTQAASRAGQAGSFIRPEILAIPAAKMDEFLQAPALAPYKLLLTRILRFKPHTLGREGREAAGDADRDGRGGRPDLPPAERHRPEVRHGQEREGADRSS